MSHWKFVYKERLTFVIHELRKRETAKEWSSTMSIEY
jgi:hypothetical protein